MADTIELLVSTKQAQIYIETKRKTLIDMLAIKMDEVNQLFTDRVKGNLSGGVLQTRTGNLLSTLMQEPAQISGDDIIGAVTAGGPLAPYGIYFEEGGTSYYEIRPINARVLAFMSGGAMMFAKMVNHPPIPKLPWFGPEVETGREQMAEGLNQVFQEVLQP